MHSASPIHQQLALLKREVNDHTSETVKNEFSICKTNENVEQRSSEVPSGPVLASKSQMEIYHHSLVELKSPPKSRVINQDF